MRKTNLARLLARRPDGIFVAPTEQGEIGPDLFRATCRLGFEGLVSKRRDRRSDGRSTGSRSRTEAIRDAEGQGLVCVNLIAPRLPPRGSKVVDIIEHTVEQSFG